MAILEFKKKDPIDPHNSGKARCAECKYEWIAVAPTGTVALDCPQCESGKGYFRFPCYPEGEDIWQCHCGCDVFVVVKSKGYMCWRCGEYQNGF